MSLHKWKLSGQIVNIKGGKAVIDKINSRFIIVSILSFLCLSISSNVYAITDRELAEYWSPVFYQQILTSNSHSLGGRADYITKVNFDADWDAGNNWNSAESISLNAYVYYEVRETRYHWFIYYAIYHPRDWSDGWLFAPNQRESDTKTQPQAPALGHLEHENDMEAIFLVVLKDPGDEDSYGILQILESMAHNCWLDYPIDETIVMKPGHWPDQSDEPYAEDEGVNFEGNHPIAYIEDEGHGIFFDQFRYDPIRHNPSLIGSRVEDWDVEGFSTGHGVVYKYIGQAEKPASPDDTDVGYDLLPIKELWDRREAQEIDGEITFALDEDGREAFAIGENDIDDKDRYPEAHPPWTMPNIDLDTYGEEYRQPVAAIKRRYVYLLPEIYIPETVEILKPTSLFQADVGPSNNPMEIDIEVTAKTPIGTFNPGIPKSYFVVKIGEKTATISKLQELENKDKYILTVTPPTQDANGLYNLTVSVGSTSDTELNAICYSGAATPIDGGLQWLRDHQNQDGSWQNDVGITSMAALAFLNQGFTEDDTTVNKAIQYILNNRNADGSFAWGTYETSIAVWALVATHNSNYDGYIQDARNWLVDVQYDEGEGINSINPDYGGWSYGSSPSWADLSNTQFALMALSAAGLPSGSNTWSKAITYLSRCQNRPASNDQPWAHDDAQPSYNDGGFIYCPEGWGLAEGTKSYGSITAAGIWSLRLCGVVVGDARVQAGLGWLINNEDCGFDDNPGHPYGQGHCFLYYYYMSIAKALVICFLDDLGGVDWYDALSSKLADLQYDDGHWENASASHGQEDIPEIATDFALLALQTKKPPAAELWMSMLLASNADIHVYDPQGRHIGMNYETGEIENEIPGASFDIDAEGKQTVTLSQLEVGKYRIELVGTGEGSYSLTVKGHRNAEVTSSETLEGTIKIGETRVGSAVVTSMVGELTIFTEEPRPVPTGLVAIPGDTIIHLGWEPYVVTGFDLAGYNVYRSTTSGTGYIKINTDSVTGTTYHDSGLTNGITYYYVVTAVDTSDNETDYSREVSATPWAAGSISGTISYTGSQTGPICVFVRDYPSVTGDPIASAIISAPGTYSVTGIPEGTYTVSAGMDTDGDALYGELDEPLGAYGVFDPVTVTTGQNTPNIDITLKGPGSISGTISYAGTQTGKIYMRAFIDSSLTGPCSPLSLVCDEPGPYCLVAPSLTLYITAFIDCNENGECDDTDPFGKYGAPDPVTVEPGVDTPNIDITLVDPTAPPTGTIVINGGATYTRSRNVTLALDAEDAVEMCFSNNNPTWSAWEPYATTKSWSLSSGDGQKTVYVKFKNAGGVESDTCSDTIILDTIASTGSISINNGAAYTDSRSVSLTLSAIGAATMCFSNNNSAWSSWESYATSKSWTLVSGDGTKRVYARFKDKAGNVSKTYSDTIILDTTPPNVAITSPKSNTYVGGTPNIIGTATDTHFRGYKLYYGQGENPSSWNLIKESDSSVDNSTLGSWDTTKVTDGTYTLKLWADDKANNSAETKVKIFIDNTPPEIENLALDQENFIPGDYVSSTPTILATLTDTGSGIDETTIDLRIKPAEGDEIVVPASSVSFNSETGEMSYTVTESLADSEYTVSLNVKDKVGNSAEEKATEFVIESELAMKKVLNYPNPFSSGTKFTYILTRDVDEVTIKVYTVAGEIVKTIDFASSHVGYNEEEWDGINDYAEELANGTYVYKITVKFGDEKVSKVQVLTVLK